MKESNFWHSHSSLAQTTAKYQCINLYETVELALVMRNIWEMKQEAYRYSLEQGKQLINICTELIQIY